MLNSMSSPPDHTGARARLSPQERRRQLVGIGLRKFVERPALELSLDEIATEAGVSRGLLFHYFPSKAAFHQAVVEAAGRRVLRNLRPDPELDGEAAITQVTRRLIDQITRRRDSYLALVYGQVGPLADIDDPGAAATTLRAGIAAYVCAADPAIEPGIAHAWVAYVEDRALHLPADGDREPIGSADPHGAEPQSTDPERTDPERTDPECTDRGAAEAGAGAAAAARAEVAHCVAALAALAELGRDRGSRRPDPDDTIGA